MMLRKVDNLTSCLLSCCCRVDFDRFEKALHPAHLWSTQYLGFPQVAKKQEYV